MAKSKSYGGLIFLLVVVLGGGGGVWYYFNTKNDKPPEFATTKVGKGDITQAVTATGDLQPVITIDVGSQISGQILDVYVDFNSKVKIGDLLAKIDPSSYDQKVRQAEADLASANATTKLNRINAERTRELSKKNLVSQQELDTAEAQLAQAESTLLTRTAALETAKVDLARCTITAPIDGMVLDRKTDKGRTVAASLNSPVLFTLVNDLSKMQINAAVAEADVGSIAEAQDVTFTVDAFPNRTFHGTVRQVRNVATTQSSVVSYSSIIDVNNADLRLKPGMTANVSIIVSQKTNVLRVANSALRARIPQELMPKAPAGGDKKGPVVMSDDDRRRIMGEVMKEAGFEQGAPPSPEVLEKAKSLARDRGIDPEMITRMANRLAKAASGTDTGRHRNGGVGNSSGFTNTVTTRTLYKLNESASKDKMVEAASAKLGISDGFFTEVLGGLNDGDTLITSVTMPNAAANQPPPGGGGNNPFGGSSRGFGGSGMGRH